IHARHLVTLPHYVTDQRIDAIIEGALAEDVGAGDVTTEATVGREVQADARLVAKATGVVAGCYVAERILARTASSVGLEGSLADGAAVQPGATIGVMRGSARSMLMGERLVLNVMQRMSGIATATRRFVEAVEGSGARILDTRKTAPVLRILDKWAVLLGGGENHRVGLYDMILIKDNHIAAAGGIEAALKAAVEYRKGRELRIEVEARTLDEVRAVVDHGGADMILLDNMVSVLSDGTVDVSVLREAVELVAGRLATEASGNVTLETVRAIAATGVDYISCGALTHSV